MSAHPARDRSDHPAVHDTGWGPREEFGSMARLVMEETCLGIGREGSDDTFGAGLLQAGGAVLAAANAGRRDRPEHVDG